MLAVAPTVLKYIIGILAGKYSFIFHNNLPYRVFESLKGEESKGYEGK